jgi:hypothetical protein
MADMSMKRKMRIIVFISGVLAHSVLSVCSVGSEFGNSGSQNRLSLESQYFSESISDTTAVTIVSSAINRSSDTVTVCIKFEHYGGYRPSEDSRAKYESLRETARQSGTRGPCRVYPQLLVFSGISGRDPFECEFRVVAPGESLVDSFTFSYPNQNYDDWWEEWPGEIYVTSFLVYGSPGAAVEEVYIDRDNSSEIVIPVP